MKTNLSLSCSLLVVVLLLAACGRIRIPAANSTTSTDGNSDTRTSGEPSGDPREDVRQAFLKLNAAKSWRARVTTSAGKLIQIEFAAPDKFHTRGELTVEGPASPPEIIIVGEDTFFKLGSMPWRKAPTGMGIGEIVQARRPDVTAEMTKYQEIKLAGSEVFDGMPMRVYEFKRQDENGKLSSGKMWISASDGLPRRLESNGGKESEGKPITTRMTVTYSDYNTDIKIEPPV
jgi:hypothetical protein